MDWNKIAEEGIKLLMEYGPRVLLAIVTLIVGLWLIKIITKTVGKISNKKGVDESLQKFLKSIVNALLKIMLLISVAQMFGIETTSFVALIGAAGLAIGLALQGGMANFAGGILILIFKPYKVGDLISTQGHTGFVKAIQIFNTILLTPDSKTVIIPNGPISNGDVTNYTTDGKLRVDLVIGISYDADIRQAKEVAMKAMKDVNGVMTTPEPTVDVLELADNSVNLAVRPWTTVDDYWGVYFGVQEAVKYAYDAAGIGIPYPQRDVHIYKHEAAMAN